LAAALMLRNPKVVIAPRYWIGFRVGEWYPPRIHFKHPKLTYLAVEN
jgi:hypothetical protein